MLKINREGLGRDSNWTIETDDTMLLVLLEGAIKRRIEDLEHLIEQGIFEHRHEEFKEEIEKYKEYLKILS